MKIEEIMSKDVKWVDFRDSVQKLEKVLLDEGASGAPVMGKGGDLVGIVSKTDLISYLAEERKKDENGDLMGAQIWQFMTPDVLSAQSSDDIRDVAKLMLDKHVHRVIVFESGKVVGIVTSFDMLKVVAQLPPD